MWSLTFNNEVLEYFKNGEDNQKRLDQYHLFIKNAEMPALQVGVPSCVDKKYSPEWISIDLYDERPCIDFQMDLMNLKFQPNQFKTIVCNAVLEHITNPFKAVSEMYRVADKGCKIWAEVPFVQRYHPYKGYPKPQDKGGDIEHGGDYFRFTPQGVVEVMKPFKMLDLMYINEGGIVFIGEKE